MNQPDFISKASFADMLGITPAIVNGWISRYWEKHQEVDREAEQDSKPDISEI